MTEDRALKRAIRRRMHVTGEKYTDARRALLGGTTGQPRHPWSYPAYWQELCERYERVRDEQGEAVAWATVYTQMHGRQLAFTLSPFLMIAASRRPSGPDAWLAQRPAVEYNAATIETAVPLVAAGFERELERNRQIAARTLELIDMWSAGASAQACAAAEAKRASMGVRPPERAPSSKAAAQPWGERAKVVGHFHSPAGMHVKHGNRGEVHATEAIATRLVVTGNHLSPQPDGIDGHRLSDYTIMPCLGSYRISRAPRAGQVRTARISPAV